MSYIPASTQPANPAARSDYQGYNAEKTNTLNTGNSSPTSDYFPGRTPKWHPVNAKRLPEPFSTELDLEGTDAADQGARDENAGYFGAFSQYVANPSAAAGQIGLADTMPTASSLRTAIGWGDYHEQKAEWSSPDYILQVKKATRSAPPGDIGACPTEATAAGGDRQVATQIKDWHRKVVSSLATGLTHTTDVHIDHASYRRRPGPFTNASWRSIAFLHGLKAYASDSSRRSSHEEADALIPILIAKGTTGFQVVFKTLEEAEADYPKRYIPAVDVAPAE